MPARTERSAGVIVFRLSPDEGGERLFLLLDYGRYWDYPKGHVEKGEDDETAALRELAEETGIRDATLIPGFRQEMTYFFRHKQKGLIRKTVIFFLAQTYTIDVKISHEHVGAEFLPYGAALDRLGYANAKQMLQAAQAFLDASPAKAG